MVFNIFNVNEEGSCGHILQPLARATTEHQHGQRAAIYTQDVSTEG
jgi:hypothetical protein